MLMRGCWLVALNKLSYTKLSKLSLVMSLVLKKSWIYGEIKTTSHPISMHNM